MTLHIIYDHQCPKCDARYIPYDQDIPCPNCGIVEDERFDYIPKAVESMLFNLEKYGSYVPPSWVVESLGDHILDILFEIFDQFRRKKKQKDFATFAGKFLSKMKWKDQEEDQRYLEKHVHEIAIRIHKELQKSVRERPEIADRLIKSAHKEERMMLDSFEYTNDSPFWYLLAVRVWEKAKVDLVPIFDSLNQRATQLELPITYGKEKSLSWAVICQLFVLSRSKTPSLSKMGFSQMMRGFGHAFTPNNFPKMGFKRILGNISSPSFPGRTFEESVADTFLANGLRLINESEIDPSMDTIILSECLSDPTMLSLGKKAVTSPRGLWEIVTEDYSRRRPGFFRRMFTNVNSWLFDK